VKRGSESGAEVNQMLLFSGNVEETLARAVWRVFV